MPDLRANRRHDPPTPRDRHRPGWLVLPCPTTTPGGWRPLIRLGLVLGTATTPASLGLPLTWAALVALPTAVALTLAGAR